MNTKEQKIEKVPKFAGRELFSEAVLVAGLTAAGYLTACAYQLTYITTFGISKLFLSVDSSLVLFTVLALLAWIGIVIIAFSLLINWKITNWIRIPVMVLVGLFLIVFPFILMLLDPKYPLMSLFSIPVVGIIVGLWIRNAHKHSKNNTEPQDGFTKLLNLADEILGTPRVLIATAAFIFVLLGAGFGRVSARMQTEFLVPSTDPNVAIITTYKDNFLGLIFDPASGVISKEVKLINQNNLPATTTFSTKSLKNSF